MVSEEIFSRKVKYLKMTGKDEWIVEIGDETITNPKNDEFLIKENQNNV